MNPISVDSSARFSILPYAFFGVVYLSTVVVALALTPSPDGIGTHTQLGLPACGFLTTTGIPCPSCGMTTAMAWLVHGSPVQSVRAQPFASVLLLVCAIGFILLPVLVKRRIPVTILMQQAWFENLQTALLCLFLLSWIYKIIVML